MIYCPAATLVLGGFFSATPGALLTATLLGIGLAAFLSGRVLAWALGDVEDRIAALTRSQGELIAHVAHELRHPLARLRISLDLSAELAADGSREPLPGIREDLGDLERVVTELLTSAELDLAAGVAASGAQPPRLALLDLATVVTRAVDKLCYLHPGRVIRAELASDLPRVRADGVLLPRTLESLLDGARKRSPPSADLCLRVVRRGPDAVTIDLHFGPGSAADVERLLASPDGPGQRPSAGLGLALCRRVVEAHGGTLVAARALHGGVVVTLTLPAAD